MLKQSAGDELPPFPPNSPTSSGSRRKSSVGLFRRNGSPSDGNGELPLSNNSAPGGCLLDIKKKKSRSKSTPCTPFTLNTGVNSLGGFSAIAAAATIGMETLGYELDSLRPEGNVVKHCGVSVTLNDGENILESLSENVRQCESNPTLHCSKTIDTNEKSTLHNNGSGEEPSNETSDSSEDFSPALSSISKEHTENRRKKKRSLPPPPVISIEDNLEEWSSKHVGKDMVDETLQMSVDSLFTHYFTNSKFFLAFHSSRKTSDIVLSPWSQKEDSEDKVRVTNFTISVTHPMGPKSSQVTETQVMKSESRPGYYYMIDVDTVNRGIPYADSFYVTSFFCLSRISDNESRVTIKSTINFKKTVWGILKSFIEKNALTGLEEFYGSLIRTLHAESEVRRSLSSSDHNRKSSTQTGKSSHNSTDVSRTRHSGEPSSEMLYEGRDGKKSRSGRSSHFDIKATASNNEKSFSLLGSFPLKLIITLLIGLFLTNLLLFFKVWTLESKLSSASRGGSGEGSSASYSLNGYSSYYLFQEDLLKLSSLPSPQTKEEWIQLLQKQELIHQIELGKWIEMLEHAMSILRNTENSLSDLEKNLHPWTLNKFRPSLFDKKLKEHSFNRESHPEESEEGTFSSPPSLASSSSAPLKEDL